MTLEESYDYVVDCMVSRSCLAKALGVRAVICPYRLEGLSVKTGTPLILKNKVLGENGGWHTLALVRRYKYLGPSP